MARVNGRLREALGAIGARLKRDKKHLVFELPNGRNFVAPKSPGDRRAEANALSDLRAAVGAPLSERRKASAEARAERRARPGRHGEPRPKMSALAGALLETGIVEQQLRAEIETLQAAVTELAAAIDELAEENRKLSAGIATLQAHWVIRLCKRISGRWMRTNGD